MSHIQFDPNSVINFITWRFGLEPLSARANSSNNIALALDFENAPNEDAPEFGETAPGGSRGAPFGQPCVGGILGAAPLSNGGTTGLTPSQLEHQREIQSFAAMCKQYGMI